MCSKNRREESAKKMLIILAHAEEGNKVHLNLPGRKGLED